MSGRNISRTPPPRQLTSNETLESLNHWRSTFRTFYKRDDAYRRFFRSDFTWDANAANYGLEEELDGLKRPAADLKEDLIDLLNTLAGFLPHSYLTDKLLKETTKWDDAFQIISEHYNVNVSCESLLDFENLHKKSEETHRQFYERLLQHSKLHLAPRGAKIDSKINKTDDVMTISMMNLIALQWLRKTNPLLIDIVKVEYSVELRGGTQLGDLVSRIAPCVDSLLKRYENGSSSMNSLQTTVNTIDDDSLVAFNYSRGQGSKKGLGEKEDRMKKGSISRQQQKSFPSTSPALFCPSCYYLSQRTGAKINFKHQHAKCPRKTSTVKMIEYEDSELFNEGEVVSGSDIGSKDLQDSNCFSIDDFQNEIDDVGKQKEDTVNIQALVNEYTVENGYCQSYCSDGDFLKQFDKSYAISDTIDTTFMETEHSTVNEDEANTMRAFTGHYNTIGTSLGTDNTTGVSNSEDNTNGPSEGESNAWTKIMKAENKVVEDKLKQKEQLLVIFQII